MTTVLIVGSVLLVAVVAVVLVLRRRRSASPVRRDAPTLPAQPVRAPHLAGRLGGVFRRAVGEDLWQEVEEALIAADAGVATAADVVARARRRGPASPDAARAAVRDVLIESFGDRDRALRRVGRPAVIVIVGVNGSGKTTTIAKLAERFMAEGATVLVAAADTFRAAAAEQMKTWGDRIGFDVVRGGDGADPASVAFDARSAAEARGRDVLIVDTAGRLHSKQNLMDELGKIVRVLGRAGEISEVLLVLDGSTGQNGIAQARAFADAVGVTGTVITKLDGSAKGGVALAVERELGIPVKLIGVGERSADLLHFDPAAFVGELLGER